MSIADNSPVAVIGCGHWGRHLVRNMHQLQALKLICDESEKARRDAAALAPGVSLVDRVDQVLSSDVKGVVIATPAVTHFELAQRALNAGKDVFVEKPLALTYAQGRELVALAEATNKILMVGHVLEYNPGVRKLLQLIVDGELGQIHYICSNRLSLGKIRREENILWSFAPHDIAIILRMMGDLPFQVAASGGAYLQPNIADVTVTHLLFDNGVRAHIYVSWLHPFKEQRLVIIGSKKMASYDDVAKKLVLYDQHVQVREDGAVPVKGDGVEVAFSAEEPLRLECEAFLRALRTREAPLTDGASGLRVLRVLQAAQRSLMINGAPVTLPLEAHMPNVDIV